MHYNHLYQTNLNFMLDIAQSPVLLLGSDMYHLQHYLILIIFVIWECASVAISTTLTPSLCICSSPQIKPSFSILVLYNPTSFLSTTTISSMSRLSLFIRTYVQKLALKLGLSILPSPMSRKRLMKHKISI